MAPDKTYLVLWGCQGTLEGTPLYLFVYVSYVFCLYSLRMPTQRCNVLIPCFCQFEAYARSLWVLASNDVGPRFLLRKNGHVEPRPMFDAVGHNEERLHRAQTNSYTRGGRTRCRLQR